MPDERPGLLHQAVPREVRGARGAVAGAAHPARRRGARGFGDGRRRFALRRGLRRRLARGVRQKSVGGPVGARQGRQQLRPQDDAQRGRVHVERLRDAGRDAEPPLQGQGVPGAGGDALRRVAVVGRAGGGGGGGGRAHGDGRRGRRRRGARGVRLRGAALPEERRDALDETAHVPPRRGLQDRRRVRRGVVVVTPAGLRPDRGRVYDPGRARGRVARPRQRVARRPRHGVGRVRAARPGGARRGDARGEARGVQGRGGEGRRRQGGRQGGQRGQRRRVEGRRQARRRREGRRRGGADEEEAQVQEDAAGGLGDGAAHGPRRHQRGVGTGGADGARGQDHPGDERHAQRVGGLHLQDARRGHRRPPAVRLG
mmetsp:Transcript_14100/g.43577  ORF Transcript_14100/g.43577 Transcript_14100/m.43577 type:complete len:371 (-) Transcript_14100:522-1634(-)